MEEAFQIFMKMQATGWRYLPYSGGLLDQPELLMKNLFVLQVRFNELKNPT